MNKSINNAITDVPSIKVGRATDVEGNIAVGAFLKETEFLGKTRFLSAKIIS